MRRTTRFTYAGWSIRPDNDGRWAVFEPGQRSGPPRADIWPSSDGEIWLCDGGRNGRADARLTFEAVLDVAIERIGGRRS